MSKTDSPEIEEQTPIAQVVDGFGQLEPRRMTLHKWTVTSYRNNTPTAHAVNLREISCTCDDMHFNKRNAEVCDHILVANHYASRNPDMSEMVQYRLAEVVQELDSRLSGVGTPPTDNADSEASESSEGDTEDSEEKEDEGEVHERDPSEEQAEQLAEVRTWFEQSAAVVGFDPAILDLSWGIAEGAQGVIVDTSPWGTEYQTGEEYTAANISDAFDDEEESLREGLLKVRDEIRYYHDPDYCNFIPEADISGLLGDE